MSHPGRIPDLVVQDLIARTDIGTLIGESVQLKRTGQNLSGLCPFHDEKTPSFTVSPIKNFYYCFGCSASGNAISFLMDYHHLSFVAACESLAQKLGIDIKYDQTQQRQSPKKATDHLSRALDVARLFFKAQLSQLPAHHEIWKYLKGRNITQASIDRFDLGFAPAGWESLKTHLQSQHISETDALNAGLLTQGKNNKVYDRFRARLMFPICDIKGKTIAFGGRVLNDEQPKYLNSPESDVFQKREALFGLDKVTRGGKLDKVLITEGYLDVVRMHQVELGYGVAALGTATSEHHIRLLFRLSDRILACFDADTAGEKAAWRFLSNSLSLLQSHQRIDFLFLPAGEDPDSYIAKHGKHQFLAIEKEAIGLSTFFINKLTADLNLQQLDDRAQFLKRALPLVDKIEKSYLKDLLIQRISELSQLSEERIRQMPTTAGQQGLSQQPQAMQNINSTGDYNNTHYNHNNYNPHESSPSTNAFKSYSKNSYGKKPYFQKQPPLPPLPSQQNLIDSLLRLLLQQPSLAQQTVLALDAKPRLQHFELFQETYDQLRSNPDASLAYLMGLWHDQPKGDYLARLAAKEFIVASEQLGLEFSDAIVQLEAIALNEALAQAGKARPLDKARLQALLEKKRLREQEKTASASVNKC